MDNRPIGVFDSGLGGLTATSELSSLLPGESIIYLGDSHNMPYGEKTHEQIVKMSEAALAFLLNKNVKAVFIACGTATSNALEQLEKQSPVPVFGVVAPAAQAAAELTRNNKVGVLATRACIATNVFRDTLLNLKPELTVVSRACPRFASMIEDGIVEESDPRVQRAVLEYLPPLREAGVDTVILGCTHYPLLSDVIGKFMGADVGLLSSGAAAAGSLCDFLRENGILSDGIKPVREYYTTGDPVAFARAAHRMLGEEIDPFVRGIEPFTFDKGKDI